MNDIFRDPDIPNSSGIYMVLDAKDKVIYVGKAKNLKNRLSSYAAKDLVGKVAVMVSVAQKIEYTITNSEVEAFLLEAELVKSLQPKFNILLKDDKSFPYIKLRDNHEYPQLLKIRSKKALFGKCFGPFVSTEAVNVTLSELQKIFKLRSCSDSYFANRTRACLQYQIGRCCAPCVGKISSADYKNLVVQIESFLSGKTQELQEMLHMQMEQYSKNLEFENAAKIRDKIKALSYIQLNSRLQNDRNNESSSNKDYLLRHFSVLKKVQEIFHLPDTPERIEVYDNSHIMGAFPVGAMIVSTPLGFDKKEYRIFNLKVKTGDDFAMLSEVMYRRLEKIDQFNIPSLMIIDGGKGHMSCVAKVMREKNINIPFVCMSKGEDRNAGKEQFHLMYQNQYETFTIDKNDPVMKYLQIIRDEVHNFAIRNHRNRRSKAITSSELDSIEGIGPARKKLLLRQFGSYKAICDASIEELAAIPSIGKSIAIKIYKHIHRT